MVSTQIKKFNSNNITSVFFVVNPLTAMISRLIIDQFELKNILIVSFRLTPVELIKSKTIFVTEKKFDAYRKKLLFDSPSGRRILEAIEGDFILFTSWAFRETNWLIKSKKCKGHFYIEEGQGSYMNYTTFDYKKLPFWILIKNNFKNRINKGDGIGYFYREDNSGFIGLHPKSFPNIKFSQKYFLKNKEKLKLVYSQKIMGYKNIGLSCAERRLEDNNWKGMIDKLIECLPNGGLIKLHPSFCMSQEKTIKIKKYLTLKTNKRIKLCDNNVILEIEMLYENKNLYGPQTSLSFYADYLGSNFIPINLP